MPDISEKPSDVSRCDLMNIKKSIGLSEQSRSHIQEHVARTGHAIDFSKFQILGRAKTDYKLKIFELLMIKSKTLELNNYETSVQLSLFQS